MDKFIKLKYTILVTIRAFYYAVNLLFFHPRKSHKMKATFEFLFIYTSIIVIIHHIKKL